MKRRKHTWTLSRNSGCAGSTIKWSTLPGSLTVNAVTGLTSNIVLPIIVVERCRQTSSEIVRDLDHVWSTIVLKARVGNGNRPTSCLIQKG
jgi:hypothetical protein